MLTSPTFSAVSTCEADRRGTGSDAGTVRMGGMFVIRVLYDDTLVGNHEV